MPVRRNVPPVQLTVKADSLALNVEQLVVGSVFVSVRTVGGLRLGVVSTDSAPLPFGACVIRVQYEIVPECIQVVAISVALTADPVARFIAESVGLVIRLSLRALFDYCCSTLQIFRVGRPALG